MPIIPRFQQQFDPNQPPRIDFGDRLMQGLMAGSQAQRAQAEAEWRKATAERYKQQSAQEKEAMDAQAAAELFKAEREFGGVQPRPGQFMPAQDEAAPGFVGPMPGRQQADYGFGADFVGPQPAPFDYQLGRGPKQPPMSVVSDASPTTAPRVVDTKGQQRRLDMDAMDKADLEAAMAIAKQNGYGPIGTTAMLQAVRQSSTERRQQFDIQELQDNFQSAIIGYQKISSELPELGAALEPEIERMKIDADRLDDQMDPAARNDLIKSFNLKLNATNELVRNERNRLIQYNRTLATVRQSRDSYDPTNPNAKLWVDAETEMLLNDRMSVEQIAGIMRGARLKEQGFRQDPETKDWLTEEDLQSRTRERRIAKDDQDRIALQREKMMQDDDFRAHDSWRSMQPRQDDIRNLALTRYESQWAIEEVIKTDPDNPFAPPIRTKVRTPIVENPRSFDEIYAEEEQVAYGRWIQERPSKADNKSNAGADGQAAQGAAAATVTSAISDEELSGMGLKKAAPKAPTAAPSAPEQQMTPGEMFALGTLTEEGAKSKTEQEKRSMTPSYGVSGVKGESQEPYTGYRMPVSEIAGVQPEYSMMQQQYMLGEMERQAASRRKISESEQDYYKAASEKRSREEAMVAGNRALMQGSGESDLQAYRSTEAQSASEARNQKVMASRIISGDSKATSASMRDIIDYLGRNGFSQMARDIAIKAGLSEDALAQAQRKYEQEELQRSKSEESKRKQKNRAEAERAERERKRTGNQG